MGTSERQAEGSSAIEEIHRIFGKLENRTLDEETAQDITSLRENVIKYESVYNEFTKLVASFSSLSGRMSNMLLENMRMQKLLEFCFIFMNKSNRYR